MSRKKPPRAPLWGRVAAQTMPRTLPATGRAPMASAPSQVAVRPGKQLTYDLTARIVDSDELPVNTIIVSMGHEGADGLPPDVADAYEDVVQHAGGAPADLDDAMGASPRERRHQTAGGRQGRAPGFRT